MQNHILIKKDRPDATRNRISGASSKSVHILSLSPVISIQKSKFWGILVSGTLSIIFFFLISINCHAQSVDAKIMARKVLRKGLKETDLGTYQGSLLLQGMAELAIVDQDSGLLNEVVAIYQKFGNHTIEGKGSFLSYKAGGNGAAFLKYHKATSVLDSQVTRAAVDMITKQKRSGEGLLTANWASEKTDQVFIDMAFAVTPFMLYSGLSEHSDEYVTASVFETLELFRVLRDSTTKLLHQSRGFNTLGKISEDNWSRGNGWGALALSTLVRDLPLRHPKRKEVEELALDFFRAVLKYQDKNGLWHQEMTDADSFTETSGSGLLLYGLGIMLEKGLLPKRYHENFKRGINGLSTYVAPDGAVSHACYSCLSPRKGTKEDYINHVWVYNDPHGFGPVVLALSQAIKMNFGNLTDPGAGKFTPSDTIAAQVKTYVRYVPERSEDLTWENNRIAFRYYGPPVRDKVGSGIDIWTKSVDYSIIDKWYRLNARGQDYHVDRGEGADFYHMGYMRGCGGTAIWRNGKPFASPTYDRHRIIRNDEKGIKFELTFDTWDADGEKVSERKLISMVNGTNFFKVESTITSDSGKDITVGIGLTTFGKPNIYQMSEKGTLACWEKVDLSKGALGTAISVNPKQLIDFAKADADHYVLIKVRSGKPFTYYAGAAWQGNNLFNKDSAWKDYLDNEAGWDRLQRIYLKK